MENIKVDAEYMNRWLGDNPIDEMNPRVMYDVQQLIKHYRSIIVPDKNVSVERAEFLFLVTCCWMDELMKR